MDMSTSEGSNITSYSWDLSIANSNLRNPGAIYTSPGTYTICLTVTNAAGQSDTKCKQDYIEVYEEPLALFTVDKTEGCSPVVVNYNNQSTSANGDIINLLWDIGGSATVINSTDANQDIQTTYTIAGSYSASLVIEDDKGCTNSFTQSNLIEVNGVDEVSLDIEVQQSCQLPWVIQYTNLNITNDVTYIWDFGNGTTYEGANPPATFYNEKGIYDLTIYMTNGSCADTAYFDNIVDTDPELSFSVSPQNICAGSELTFTDDSQLPADSLLWSFGDGNTSNNISPTHIYNAGGCYDVTLIRYSNTCSDTTTLSCLTVRESPDMSYTINNQYYCDLPATVTAEGMGAGKWFWSMEGVDTLQTDTAVFEILAYGTYDLNLYYEAEGGCIIRNPKTEVIVQPFETALPTQVIEGCGPLSFTLSDSISSEYDIASWQWNIGNGLFTSDEENPSFTIPDTGRYDLELIVTNEIGCSDTLLAEEHIRVGLMPEVNFTGGPLEGCRDITRSFSDLSSGFADEWQWNFGTGTDSQLSNPTHDYDDAGVFDVTLTASHNGCSDSLTLTDFITVLEPNAQFVLHYNCENPYSVNIENVTKGADSLVWNIHMSDDNIITSMDSIMGTMVFPDRGKYPISLYGSSDSTGCEDIQEDTIHILDPIAAYELDTLRGCAPLVIGINDLSTDGFFYNYFSDTAYIDTTDFEFPEVIFWEGGLFQGPTLVITDIHECRDTFQLQDTVIVNKLVADIAYDDVICIPAEAEYIDNSTDLLGNIISWEWKVANGAKIDTNQNTSYFYDEQDFYDLELRVEDDWGCKDSVILSQSILASTLLPDFNYDTLGCTFAYIKFKAEGDHQFVDSYLWEFGDGNTSTAKNPWHIYENEGIYSVCLTMYDYRGCDKTICKEDIILIKDPVAAFTGDPIESTCPPLFTQFQNTSANSFTYSWDFGDNSGNSLSDAPGHLYTEPGIFNVSLIATSTPVCSDTLTLSEYVKVEGPLADFTTNFDLTCLPQPLNLFATSDKEYKYVWDYGNGVLDSVPDLVMQDSSYYEYTEPGTYTPNLIVIDERGCTRSFRGDPIRVDDIQLEVAVTDSVYCGVPNTVHVENLSSGTTESVTYNWNIDGPEPHEISGKEAVVDITIPGMYNISLYAEYGGCSDTLLVPEMFEVGTIPEATFEIDQDNICSDVDVHLQNNSTISYGSIVSWEWTLPDNNTSAEEEPIFTASGVEDPEIQLIVTSNLGCKDTLLKSYEIAPSLLANAGPDATICLGETATLLGLLSNTITGSSYFWTGDGLSCTDCLTPEVTLQDTSVYVFTAIHPNGCISTDTTVVYLAPLPLPEVALTAEPTICEGGTATIEILDYDPSLDYYWNPLQAGLDCYNNCATISANPSEPTTYQLEVVNEYGCRSNDSIIIDIEISFENILEDRTAICAGSELELIPLSGTDPVWQSDQDVSCQNCDSTLISPELADWYYVTVSSPLGCRYTDSIWVDLVDESAVDAGEDIIICKGEKATVNGIGDAQLQWEPTNLFDDPTLATTEVSILESTMLTLMYTDEHCTVRDEVYVEVKLKAELLATGDTICFNEVATLSGEGLFDQVLWYDEASQIGNEDEIMIEPKTSGEYMAIASYRTCESDSSTVFVKVHEEIDYVLEDKNYVVHTNDEIYLAPEYNELRSYSYEWFPSDGLNCNNCPSPIIISTGENTSYNIFIEDTESGCQKEIEINVRFLNTCTESAIGIPNIFSPYGNSTNNKWGPITDNKDEFLSIDVFDRWGNLQFHAEDADARWDGFYAGQMALSGVYVYKMQLICPSSGEEYTVYGDVTIVY